MVYGWSQNKNFLWEEHQLNRLQVFFSLRCNEVRTLSSKATSPIGPFHKGAPLLHRSASAVGTWFSAFRQRSIFLSTPSRCSLPQKRGHRHQTTITPSSSSAFGTFNPCVRVCLWVLWNAFSESLLRLVFWLINSPSRLRNFGSRIKEKQQQQNIGIPQTDGVWTVFWKSLSFFLSPSLSLLRGVRAQAYANFRRSQMGHFYDHHNRILWAT